MEKQTPVFTFVYIGKIQYEREETLKNLRPFFVLDGGLQVFKVFESSRHRKPIGFAFATLDGYYWQTCPFFDDLPKIMRNRENTMQLYSDLKRFASK